jgi:hypothetical protein
MPTLTHNRANSVIMKDAKILNIIHNIIFNLCDTFIVLKMEHVVKISICLFNVKNTIVKKNVMDIKSINSNKTNNHLSS